MKKTYVNPEMVVVSADLKSIMIDTSFPEDKSAKGASLDFQSDDADEDDLGW